MLSALSAVRFPSALCRAGIGVASGLCVLALPLVLVGFNLRAVALNERFYLAEFAQYGIGAQTGLSQDELRRVAAAFIDYFQAPPGRMNVQIARGGALQPLFNERELAQLAVVPDVFVGAAQVGVSDGLAGAVEQGYSPVRQGPGLAVQAGRTQAAQVGEIPPAVVERAAGRRA